MYFQLTKKPLAQSRLWALLFTSNRRGWWYEKDNSRKKRKRKSDLASSPVGRPHSCCLISFKQSYYQKSPEFAYRIPQPAHRFRHSSSSWSLRAWLMLALSTTEASNRWTTEWFSGSKAGGNHGWDARGRTALLRLESFLSPVQQCECIFLRRPLLRRVAFVVSQRRKEAE